MREQEEVLLNEYWMFENEPFNVVRYKENGKQYLVGLEIPESFGVERTRERKGYLKPEEE